MKEWLRQPIEKDELRYETLLKLFFGNEEGPEQALRHIGAFREKIMQELPYLLGAEKVLKEHLDEDTTHRYYRIDDLIPFIFPCLAFVCKTAFDKTG